MLSNPRTVGFRVLMTCCLAVVALLAGLANAQYVNPDEIEILPENNETTPRLTQYHYSSVEAGFQTTMPSGCAELRMRYNEPDMYVGEDTGDAILLHTVICERFGVPGDGCSVTAIFDVTNSEGEGAGPLEVLGRVRKVLETFNVNIVKQVPIKREFADGLVIEGVDVFCTAADGSGEFWVRGLLSYHDIYLLTAWSTEGDLWKNPVYLDFFNDFLPYAE